MSKILVIDDHPEQLEPIARTFGGDVLHPDAVSAQDLADVDLCVVDFVLDDWPGREATTAPLLKPLDGRALIEIIRAHVSDDRRPVGFVLTTAEPDRLAPGLVREKRESVLARLNNLEWMISKDTHPDVFIVQIQALSDAIASLPDSWPESPGTAMREVVSKLLQLNPERAWADVAWESLFACHPPIHGLSISSHGLAFVRWLAHRIIPYPTFLIDDLGLATRLGITVESLQAAFHADDEFVASFSEMQFEGILNSLSGRRWWRSAVEYLLWEWTEGNPFSSDSIFAAISQRTEASITRLTDTDSVVCLDADLRPVNICSSIEAVRVQPDDWPAFADPAWASIELLKSGNASLLRSLVVPSDESRFGYTE